MLVRQWEKDVVGKHCAKANKLGIERTHDGRQNPGHEQAGEPWVLHQRTNHGAEGRVWRRHV